MAALDSTARDRVQDIVLKPEFTELRQIWILATWRPALTYFLDQLPARVRTRAPATTLKSTSVTLSASR